MDYEEYIQKFNIQINDEQAAGVKSMAPTALIAVPGSGKTTTLIYKLGYMIHCRGISPSNILTITYTRASAADMRTRYAQVFGQEDSFYIPFKTINALALEIYKYTCRILGREEFNLDEQVKSKLCAQILREYSQEFVDDGSIEDFAMQISYIKNKRLTREETADEKLTIMNMEVWPMYSDYLSAMNDLRLMDFDDQLVFALDALERYPDILQYFQHKYPYILVDEAQDTSLIQHCIIKALYSGHIFMVGDEDQSIYGFRAAHPDALLNFTDDYPGGHVLFLNKNYRSTPNIIKTSSKFIKQNKRRHPKRMISVRPADQGNLPIRLIQLTHSNRQYSWLGRQLKEAYDNNNETAVLYRVNTSAVPIIRLLLDANIPFRLRGGHHDTFFGDSTVQTALNLLLLSMQPYSVELFRRTCHKTRAFITSTQREQAIRQLDPNRHTSIWHSLSTVPTRNDKQADNIYEVWQAIASLKGKSALLALMHIESSVLSDDSYDKRLLSMLKSLVGKGQSIQSFISDMRQLKKSLADVAASEGHSTDYSKSASQPSPITLSTVHSSKGLEFDNVILIDVTDEIFPKIGEGGLLVNDIEEERRLFYVAMTRARNQLTFLKYKNCNSRFINAITRKPKKR